MKQYLLLIILPFISAFTITYLVIPNLIEIAYARDIFDKPNPRSSHTKFTPFLGGVGILLGILLTSSFYISVEPFSKVGYILIAILLIFCIGLRDDLLITSPIKKLLGQLVTAGFVVSAGIRLTDFQGTLGFSEIPFVVSIIISLLTITYIVNAFNLIDGINGLSAGIGIYLTLSLGVWFFLLHLIPQTVLSFSIAGTLIAFLIYNRTPAKIFMGDSGSLLVGLLIAILLIEFVQQHNYQVDTGYYFTNAPLMALGIFAIPLFDFLRVASERFIFGKSPMSPDRKHIHHLFVDAGYSHNKSSLSIVVLNAILTIIAYCLQKFGFVGPTLLLMAIFWVLISYLKTKVILNKEIENTNTNNKLKIEKNNKHKKPKLLINVNKLTE